jgi:4-hydroxy-tetrahydrodipicolinate synthase
MSKKAIHWSGVFPAVSTQFRSDYSLDLDATHAVMKNLVRDGVSGLVVCGSVGENTSLTTEEKLQIIEVAKDAAGGKIPVIAGVAEFTTAFAQKMAKEAERVGVDGIMVMPALVYSSKPHETAAHFRSVATATDLPIMVYNNPPIYKNDVTPDILATLTDCDNIVCFKDSSGDTRRLSTCVTPLATASCCSPGWMTWWWRASPWARKGGSPECRTLSRAKGKRCSVLPHRNVMKKRWRCTAGLCRCCISMRVRIWCSASSCAKSCWDAAAPSPVRRVWRWKETRQQVVAIVEQALATRPVLPDVGL